MKARALRLDQAVARRHDAANMATYDISADRRGRSSDVVEWVELDRIAPSPDQMREEFDDAELRELYGTFGENFETLTHYPTVRRAADGGGFVLVGGERRLRAARIGGHARMPVIVKTMTDAEAAIATAAENLMRVGLSAWATAQGYVVLRDLLRQQGKRKNAGAGSVVGAGALHKKSQVESYLRVGDAITRKLLVEAGAGSAEGDALDPQIMRALSLTTLDAVAQLAAPEARLENLRLRVAALRAAASVGIAQLLGGSNADSERAAMRDSGEVAVGAAAAHALAALQVRDARRVAHGRKKERPMPGVAELQRGGGFVKKLGAPLDTLPLETIDRHAGDVAAGFAALAEVKHAAGMGSDTVVYSAPVFTRAEQRTTAGAQTRGQVMYMPAPERLHELHDVGQAVSVLGDLCRGLVDRAAALGADEAGVEAIRQALDTVVRLGRKMAPAVAVPSVVEAV